MIMIRLAETQDLTAIMEILQVVVQKMHNNNNFQWDAKYPREQDFIEDINQGELFVSVQEGEVAGFICINKVEPEEYKGLAWSLSQEALVIHRMAVSPAYQKLGIGAQLVGFADELAKQKQMKYLKIDTYSGNPKAQRLFEKLGYTFVGEMHFNGKEKAFYCYEKLV